MATPPGVFTDEPTLKLQELLNLLELQGLRQRRSESDLTAARFYDDPLGFVDACIKFPMRGPRGGPKKPGGLAPYQREIIADLPKVKRLAVRGPRGLGKTTLAALVVLWFAMTRDMAGVDWKIVTTAGSWQQLEDFLWPEIRKWAYQVDWKQVGRGPLNDRDELMKTKLRLRFGHATAGSPDRPEKLEGAHADSVLYVFDESKLVSAETFDAAEGAFSAADEDEGLEAYALAISTPGEPAGRFYDIHTKKAGLEDWSSRHVTLDEAIKAGRMTRRWADQRAKLWGVNSALYMNHVLGEFCADDEDAIVPLSWAEMAIERWRAWDTAGRPVPDTGPWVVGVDPARSGRDRTAFAFRAGNVIERVVTYTKADTMETTGHVVAALAAGLQWQAVVDVIGIGAGVVDRLKEQKQRSEGFNAARKTTRKDLSGHYGFYNLRAAAWWRLRESLDPSRSPVLCLPPDDELLGDITALHYKPMSDGKILVEPKDDVRKRLNRSTDKGDAVMQAWWLAAGSWHDAYGTETCENCARSFLQVGPDGKQRTHCPWCRNPLEETESEAA